MSDFKCDTCERLYKDNQRLRWRHVLTLPEWNDLSDEHRVELCRIGDTFADDGLGGQYAVQFYMAIRKFLSSPIKEPQS